MKSPKVGVVSGAKTKRDVLEVTLVLHYSYKRHPLSAEPRYETRMVVRGGGECERERGKEGVKEGVSEEECASESERE